MSLSEAVLEIADEMEQESKGLGGVLGVQISGWYKQLRRAVKAVEGSELPILQPVTYQKPNWEQEAHAEFRKNTNQKVDVLERFEGQQIEIVDGPLTGDDGIPTFRDTPPGGKSGMECVMDDLYVYKMGEDGRLYFQEEKTKAKSQGVKSAGGIVLG